MERRPLDIADLALGLGDTQSAMQMACLCCCNVWHAYKAKGGLSHCPPREARRGRLALYSTFYTVAFQHSRSVAAGMAPMVQLRRSVGNLLAPSII